MKLDTFNSWQWELAIVASRFRLGLLSDDEIIAFTHKLMDNGFYDDVMLDIIEDDPLFSFRETEFIQAKFTQVWQNLDLPVLEETQARWIWFFYVHYSFALHPHNFNYAYIERLDFYFYDYWHYFHASNLKKHEEIYEELRQIQLAYMKVTEEFGWIECDKDPLHDENLIKSIQILYAECENWLNRNQSKILEIMHQLFL